MGLRSLLLPASRPRRNAAVVRGEDASYQPLQPTCCHEYPQEHTTLKLRALTLPTAASPHALPLEPTPELPLVFTYDDAE